MESLTVGLFLAVTNQAIIDYLIAPIKKKYANADFWWVLYVALATGAAIGWLSGINLFEAYIPDLVVGRVVSSVAIGGGSSLLHDIFDN